CGPRQVVEVLQAVHLLLAFELFVVVVGVDPRWLLRSLCSHYDEILEADGPGGGSADGWPVTPAEYLEETLNIPLVLPGLAERRLHGLARSMAEGGTAPSPGSPPPVTPPTGGAASDGAALGHAVPGSATPGNAAPDRLAPGRAAPDGAAPDRP